MYIIHFLDLSLRRLWLGVPLDTLAWSECCLAFSEVDPEHQPPPAAEVANVPCEATCVCAAVTAAAAAEQVAFLEADL